MTKGMFPAPVGIKDESPATSRVIMDQTHIGIVGYGKMGASIFKWLAQRYFPITVLLRSEQKAIHHRNSFFKLLNRFSRRGVISDRELQRRKQAVTFTHHPEDMASARLLIETIEENYDTKVKILRDLESVIAQDAYLTTNTSSLGIHELALQLKEAGRFCGLHFFHPFMLINFIEIIKWEGTSSQTIHFMKDFCSHIDRKAVVVHDAPGSVINSILVYYYLEALYILEEGCALPSKIDGIAKKYFYIGPCESMDVIGIDFFVAALARSVTGEKMIPDSSQKSFSARIEYKNHQEMRGFYSPSLFDKLLSAGRLGKKVAKGIYLYQKDRPVDDLPEYYLNAKGNKPGEPATTSDDTLAKRLLFSIFNGMLHYHNNSSGTIKDLDYGVKEALQMNNGPLAMMQRLGKSRLKNDFEFLSHEFGERFNHSAVDIF